MMVHLPFNSAVRHSVTTDGWQSSTCDSYNTTTCHYAVLVTCELERHVLDAKKWNESHSANNLANVLKSTHIKWNLREPVCVLENITKPAVHDCRFWCGCFAHDLNLCVTKGTAVPEVQSLLERCRKQVFVFKYSGQNQKKTGEFSSCD